MTSPVIPNPAQASTTTYRPATAAHGDASSLVEVDGEVVNLKNRHFAALLGLMLPGLGHYYQGRKQKAMLYAICILGLFITGLVIGNGRVVYMSFTSDDYRLQFPAQMCVGLPTLPAILHANANKSNPVVANDPRPRNEEPRPLTWATFMAPPEDSVELSRWHFKSSAGFELGTLMTAIAGLLNILAVFDAFAGPIATSNQPKKDDSNPE